MRRSKWEIRSHIQLQHRSTDFKVITPCAKFIPGGKNILWHELDRILERTKESSYGSTSTNIYLILKAVFCQYYHAGWELDPLLLGIVVSPNMCLQLKYGDNLLKQNFIISIKTKI